MKKVGVSACLMGKNVRYNNTNKKNDELITLLKECEIIEICPEVFAGLPIPHNPIEINNNKIIDKYGNDYTLQIQKGNNIALQKVLNCDFLVLKTKSPTCGYKRIYDGSFSNNLINGNGSFVSLCLQNNIKVFTEEDLLQISKLLK